MIGFLGRYNPMPVLAAPKFIFTSGFDPAPERIRTEPQPSPVEQCLQSATFNRHGRKALKQGRTARAVVIGARRWLRLRAAISAND